MDTKITLTNMETTTDNEKPKTRTEHPTGAQNTKQATEPQLNQTSKHSMDAPISKQVERPVTLNKTDTEETTKAHGEILSVHLNDTNIHVRRADRQD